MRHYFCCCLVKLIIAPLSLATTIFLYFMAPFLLPIPTDVFPHYSYFLSFQQMYFAWTLIWGIPSKRIWNNWNNWNNCATLFTGFNFKTPSIPTPIHGAISSSDSTFFKYYSYLQFKQMFHQAMPSRFVSLKETLFQPIVEIIIVASCSEE